MNTFLNFLFLLLVMVVANIAYKGRTFNKTNWKKVAALSVWFLICSVILLGRDYEKLFVNLNFATIGAFLATSLIWFISPKLIRLYGTYPDWYLKDKEGNKRFLVRFESSSMLVKYFEIIFQQGSFLFLFFVVLSGLPMVNSILIFTIIVAIIHLGNLFFLERKWALFYTVLSIPMAILFGYMISKGFILLTASLHLAFYLVFNARYWFVKEKSIKK